MLDTSDIYIICYPECQRIEPTTVFVPAVLLKPLDCDGVKFRDTRPNLAPMLQPPHTPAGPAEA